MNATTMLSLSVPGLRSRRLLAAAMALVCLGLSSALPAAETNAPASPTASAAPAAPATNTTSRLDYNHYRLIAERNIFNGTRSPGRANTPRDTRRAPRVDEFALAGTMSYEKGRYAFFDGSSSDYRKVLQEGGRIGGFTVSEITPRSVKLAAEGKTLELPINAQMRREDEGAWRTSGRSYASSSSTSNSSSSNTGSDRPGGSDAKPASSSSSSSSSGEMSDVLKRLMEQREKETK